MKALKDNLDRVQKNQIPVDAVGATEGQTESPDEEKFKLTGLRLKRMVFHVFRQFDDQYYAGFAAQIAYFFFMSSIPTIIVLTQVLGIFDVSLDFILEWFEKHVDSHLSSFVVGLFSQSSVGVTNLFLVILALWSASGLEFSLSRLTCHILTDGRYRYNFLKERFRSVPMAVLMIAIIAFSLIAYVYGELIINALLGNTRLADLLIFLRGPLIFVAFFLMVSGIYYVLPRIKVTYRAMLPGAVVATLGMVLVTYIYSIYVGRTTSYDILYGSFANIVALLLWFYLISWVLCIGMMFNRSWDIYMARGRLSPKLIKKTLMEQLGSKKKFDMHYTSNPVRTDRTVKTVANELSKKFVPGYAEARANCTDKYDNAPDREKDS